MTRNVYYYVEWKRFRTKFGMLVSSTDRTIQLKNYKAFLHLIHFEIFDTKIYGATSIYEENI